jgi:hypothetical protein
MKLKFEVAVSADRLLEEELKIFDKNVLVIPKVRDLPIKQLIPHHQLLITFSYTTPGLSLITTSNYYEEVEKLYNFLSDHGKIVDLNLEYMPHCIVVTYTRHDSVRFMLAKGMLMLYI